MGKSVADVSKSLTDPSPQAASNWFSCASDQAVSYMESWVSNLGQRSGQLSLRKKDYAMKNGEKESDETKPFLMLYASICQAQNVESTISNQPKIGGGGYGEAIVEERRVFHSVSIKTLGSVL
ncbi:hypothetical protein Golomagni_00997 [Golovinomyces magnicellulatus]|nr:hypothetical protein Golomagni_00997 [Golovinomyces magnicellulatus]